MKDDVIGEQRVESVRVVVAVEKFVPALDHGEVS
jgi:hypothetical protein